MMTPLALRPHEAKPWLINAGYSALPNAIRFGIHRRMHRAALPVWARSPFVLLHIPKTAGTSLNHALGMPGLGHLTYRELCETAPGWFDHRKRYIAVLRDPVDRLRSAWRYARQTRARKGWTSLAHIACHPTLDSLLNTVRPARDYFLRPAATFIEGIPPDRLTLVHHGRLAESLPLLAEVVGRPLLLPQLNTAGVVDDGPPLSAESVARVRAAYAADYALMEHLGETPGGMLAR